MFFAGASKVSKLSGHASYLNALIRLRFGHTVRRFCRLRRLPPDTECFPGASSIDYFFVPLSIRKRNNRFGIFSHDHGTRAAHGRREKHSVSTVVEKLLIIGIFEQPLERYMTCTA